MKLKSTNNKLFDFSEFFFRRKNICFSIIALLFLVGVYIVVLYYVRIFNEFTNNEIHPEERQRFLALVDSIESISTHQKNFTIESPFNPDTLTEKQWVSLGFSERQAEVIIKYKKSIGGFFTFQDIKSCYVISKDKFEELKPLVCLTERESKKVVLNANSTNNTFDDLKIFNPDTLSLNGWKGYGFTDKQAQVILKYKKSLGGFRNKNQLKKSYVINEYTFKKLEPYLVFDNPEIIEEKIDINKASAIDFQKLGGISIKASERIIKYRKLIGGFAFIKQVKNVYGLENISIERVNSLFYADPHSINRINITEVEESKLYHHPLLTNYQAHMLLKHRELTNPKIPDILLAKEFDGYQENIFRAYFYFGTK